MSEFSSLSLPGTLEEGADLVRRAGQGGGVVPAGETCALVVLWEACDAVQALAPRLWQDDHAEDQGLWLVEYQSGREVLKLDFSLLWDAASSRQADPEDDAGEQWSDESVTPALAAERSQQSIVRARAQGHLTPRQSETPLGLYREGPRFIGDGSSGDGALLAPLSAEQRSLFQADPAAAARLALADSVPRLLGFEPLRWLRPEDLAEFSAGEWQRRAPGALLLG